MNRWFFAGALELVLIVGRHGIRSPLQKPEELARYAAQPWPQWPVGTGILTPKGAEMERKIGRYFEERYAAEGLLTGDAGKDAPAIVLRADSDQRTIASARQFGEGLAPGVTLSVRARPLGAADPLFAPVKAHVGHPEVAVGAAAALGRMGGDPAGLVGIYRPAINRLQRILFGDGLPAAERRSLLSLPSSFGPGPSAADLLGWRGPFRAGLECTEAFVLEYEEGMPQVGWGRADPHDLQELLALHAAYFNYTHGTFYCAQVEASNLATHVRESLEQAAEHRPVAGAIGGVGTRMLVLLGHDANQIALGSLLNVSWIIPGSALNPVLPSGALVFEMRRASNGGHMVRLEYIAPTMEQMRRGDSFTLAHPPAIAPIFIPGCSSDAPGYDAPLPALLAKLAAVADPRFVTAEPD